MKVAITNEMESFIVAKPMKNNTYKLSGRNIDLINILAETLNFTINYTFISEEGYLLENGTTKGVFEALMNKKADLSISDWWLKTNRLNYFDASSSYISDQTIFIIPPGQEFSSIEKLFYTFTLETWSLVIGVFAIGVVVIIILKCWSRTIQDFVFGVGVHHPLLNIFIAFIGGSQTKLPKRNFARFLLMMFLMYSLVIRTLYQASFFELLKSSKPHKEVQTIEEMVENDFTFNVPYGNADLFNGTESIKDRFEFLLQSNLT